MKIIVDANIIFSAILNSNGKIGDLLINSDDYFAFIAPEFLRLEIAKHYKKLSKISGLSIDNIKKSERIITQKISFIAPEIINKSIWNSAAKLVEDIDPNDTMYIALSKHTKSKIWSGDKKLTAGLNAKNFKNIISTNQLFDLRENLLNKNIP